MQLNYELVLISDATTTFDPVVNEVTLLNVKLFLGDVRTTREIMSTLG